MSTQNSPFHSCLSNQQPFEENPINANTTYLNKMQRGLSVTGDAAVLALQKLPALPALEDAHGIGPSVPVCVTLRAQCTPDLGPAVIAQAVVTNKFIQKKIGHGSPHTHSVGLHNKSSVP
jgi:hypothetical protein